MYRYFLGIFFYIIIVFVLILLQPIKPQSYVPIKLTCRNIEGAQITILCAQIQYNTLVNQLLFLLLII